MKSLELEQMEQVKGGDGCSAIAVVGGSLVLIGGALALGALVATNPWVIAGLAGGAKAVNIAGGTTAVAGMIACTGII